MSITPAQLATQLFAAAEVIDEAASVAVRGAAAELAQDQRQEIKRRTGRTAETISAVDGDGGPMQTGDLEAFVGAGEPGNSGFVGRFLETGTARTPPQPWAFQTVERRAQQAAGMIGRAAEASL